MTESYFDIDGKPIGLAELCIREPGWAANRIRAMRATIDELTAKIEGPAPVAWVDGRAKVGDVTVVMYCAGVGDWSYDLLMAQETRRGAVEGVDEATAKRIAIAVARDMQR